MLPSNICGGTTKFVGAGTPLKTLPTRSNIDPWQGQKKPPDQEASHGFGSTSGKYFGAHPRWVQTPEKTEYSGLFDLDGFKPLYGSTISSEFGSASLMVIVSYFVIQKMIGLLKILSKKLHCF